RSSVTGDEAHMTACPTNAGRKVEGEEVTRAVEDRAQRVAVGCLHGDPLALIPRPVEVGRMAPDPLDCLELKGLVPASRQANLFRERHCRSVTGQRPQRTCYAIGRRVAATNNAVAR